MNSVATEFWKGKEHSDDMALFTAEEAANQGAAAKRRPAGHWNRPDN